MLNFVWSLVGGPAVAGLVFSIPAIVVLVAFFVIRSEEKRTNRSLGSGRDAVVYFLANLFLIAVYGALTLTLVQLFLGEDTNWSFFRAGFVLMGVSAAGLWLTGLARRSLNPTREAGGRDHNPVAALKNLGLSGSPYVKCLAGFNVAVVAVILAGLTWAGLFGALELVANERLEFDAVSQPARVGVVLWLTSSAFLWLNSRIFAACPPRPFDANASTSPDGTQSTPPQPLD